MKVSQAAASSKIQGFGYGPKASGSFSQAAFGVGAGATVVQTFTLNTTNAPQNAASLSRIRFNGLGYAPVDNAWFQIFGQWECRTGAAKADVAVSLQRVQNALLIKVSYKNSTAGAITVPAHTLDIVTYFYTAPW